MGRTDGRGGNYIVREFEGPVGIRPVGYDQNGSDEIVVSVNVRIVCKRRTFQVSTIKWQALRPRGCWYT